MKKSELGYVISHSGGWPGYTTSLSRNVDKDQTFIVLSNNNANSPAISNAIQHILNGKPVVMPYQHKEITMDSLSMEQFVGKYKSTDEIIIERSRKHTLSGLVPTGKRLNLNRNQLQSFFILMVATARLNLKLMRIKKW